MFLYGIYFYILVFIQSHILRLQMGSTNFIFKGKGQIIYIKNGKLLNSKISWNSYFGLPNHKIEVPLKSMDEYDFESNDGHSVVLSQLLNPWSQIPLWNEVMTICKWSKHRSYGVQSYFEEFSLHDVF